MRHKFLIVEHADRKPRGTGMLTLNERPLCIINSKALEKSQGPVIGLKLTISFLSPFLYIEQNLPFIGKCLDFQYYESET